MFYRKTKLKAYAVLSIIEIDIGVTGRNFLKNLVVPVKSTHILENENKIMLEYWQLLKSVVSIKEDVVNSFSNIVKEKTLILHPIYLEHLVLRNTMTLVVKTSNNEHDWTPVKYLNVLHHNITQKRLQQLFLSTVQKYYQFPILGTLDMSGHFHQKG